MNPANFPNVGGAMPGGAKPQMQNPQNNDAQFIFNHAVQALQIQPPFTGWRAEVPLQERALKVYQILSSLRLIQPQINLTNAAQAALTFEQKALGKANQKADYDKECNDKLAHIRDTRVRQAAVLQNGMVPQGPGTGIPGVGQNQVQGAMPQMNRPMQASPIPGQQQMPMGMNDHRAAIHQQQQQQQQQQQAQEQQQQQRAQQRQGSNVTLPDDLNSLPPQEHEHVRRLAQQMLMKTSQEDMEKIKLNLQNMTPEQKQYLAGKQVDPMTYFFRSQALSQLRRHKRNRIEMAHAPNNNAMVGDPMMNAQQRQMFQSMMNLQRNSTFPSNPQTSLDPSSFIGNVENIQGQQADGLRSQEAGQLVVPASSSQMNQTPFTPQNVFQPGPQLGQANQANMNGAGISPQVLAQSHLQNQPVPQDRPQQAAPAQAQTQAAARAQAAQKAQMAMSSQAGQGTNPQMQPQIPQQSPAMPMLNRPMAPGQMSPSQVAAQVRPPSRPQSIGQRPAGVQSLPGQPAMQGRPQIPANLPPAVQEQLAQMTPEQINAFLITQRRRAMANSQMARANAAQQQGVPMQQSLSQPGQGQPVLNGQMGNNPNMRATVGLQQQMPNMAGGQMQNPMIPGQQMSAQQQQQQRQQLYKFHLLRQQSGGLEMTPEQLKEMDRRPFPPSIAGNSQTTPVPKNIKTWGPLKQWAAANPQALGGVDLQKLTTLQKLHYAQIVAQGKENNRNSDQAGQGNMVPMMPQSQQFANGQQQGPMNMPAIPPVTPHEIQMARQRFGAQVQQYTDDQLRELLHRNRVNRAVQHRAMQNLAAQQNINPGQQAQPAQVPPTTAAQGTPQAKQASQPPQQTPLSNQQAQAAKAAQAAEANKGTKASASKVPAKRKSNNEDSLETQNPSGAVPTEAAAPQGASVPGAPRPNLPFTREQWAAMSPQQRAQVEAHMRRQQGQPRAPINRASAEEAWSHLPDHIKQLYNEIARNMPAGDPVILSPDQRALMAQQLRECIDLLCRMDTLVQWFAKIPNQEKNVRSLLAVRMQLMRQFKPIPEWALNDQLTISPDHLTGCMTYIKKLFHAMITRVNQHQNQPAGQRPNVPQGPAVAVNAAANQNNMPALNANNLQQLQQQEEAVRARRASSQTTSGNAPGLPPAPFGAPSPRGVPHAYGPGSMPPEKLKLPPPKKRKQSHAGVTPGQAPTPGTPSSKTPTNKPAQTAGGKPSSAALAGAFKCGVPDCQHHYYGFATQSALDKHIEESHKVEETIEDPLEFALESIRNSLVKEEKPEAPSTKKGEVPSAHHKSPSKPEAKPEGMTPATAGATPMGRIPSQHGVKSASPASNQQMTPRPTSGKAPVAMKSTVSKEGKKDTGKTAEPFPVETKDPWADSAISLEAIHDTFMDFGNEGLPGLGVDPMEEFLNSDMFSNPQTQDTPESVEAGAGTQTPKDGELSKEEEMNVNIGSAPDENWIPADWLCLPSRFEDDFLVSGPGEIDWDSMDRKDTDMNDDTGIAIYAM